MHKAGLLPPRAYNRISLTLNYSCPEEEARMVRKPAATESTSNVSKDELLKYYRDMLLIRRFEERAGQLYGMGLIGGFCHLYIGQEAIAVGVQATVSATADVRSGPLSAAIRHDPRAQPPAVEPTSKCQASERQYIIRACAHTGPRHAGQPKTQRGLGGRMRRARSAQKQCSFAVGER